MFGLKSLHPLISIVDLKEATRFPMHVTMNYGVYALFLKQTRCGDIRYGRQTYDYQEGTVTSFAPGQVVEVHCSIPTLYAAQRWDVKSGIILSSPTAPAKRSTYQIQRKASSPTA